MQYGITARKGDKINQLKKATVRVEFNLKSGDRNDTISAVEVNQKPISHKAGLNALLSLAQLKCADDPTCNNVG